jgi:hypothetical protein
MLPCLVANFHLDVVRNEDAIKTFYGYSASKKIAETGIAVSRKGIYFS